MTDLGLLDVEYIVSQMGKREAIDLVTATEELHGLKSHVKSSKYKKALSSFLSCFEFDTDGEEEFMEASIVMEKNQVIRNVTMTKDNAIALARAGIIVVQNKNR